MKPFLSRREFAKRFGATLAALGVVTGMPLAGKLILANKVEWYEVVQDAQNPTQWHVNHFYGPALGDLARAEQHSHQVMEAVEAADVTNRLRGYPMRIQYRDGHKEQTFSV